MQARCPIILVYHVYVCLEDVTAGKEHQCLNHDRVQEEASITGLTNKIENSDMKIKAT